MAARRKKHPQGRRTRLMEPGVHDTLVTQSRAGVPLPIAAAAAGIADRTFLDWMQRGAAEEARLAQIAVPGEPEPEPDDHARPFLELYREVMKARATAAARAMANVQRVAVGGFVVEETTRRYKNDAGQWVEETTVKRQAPDWRASSWILERTQRGHFGRDATQVELITSGTTAAEDGTPDGELAARVRENIAALVPTAQITDGSEVVDAELVEDEPAT